MTKTPATEAEKDHVKAMLDRMEQVYNVDRESLADIIGIQFSSMKNLVSLARRPYAAMEKCSADTGVSFDWLLHGDSKPKYPLTTKDLAQIELIVAGAIDGAVNYDVIKLMTPTAREKILAKINTDLKKWHEPKAQAVLNALLAVQSDDSET